MAENGSISDGQTISPVPPHERTDANFSWILGLVVFSALFGALMCYLVLLFLFRQRDELAVARKSRFPLAVGPTQTLPKEPRLEQLNRLDGQTRSNVYQREKRRLDQLWTYGPTKEKGFARIPIDRAITLVVKKLPVRKQQAEHDPPRDNGLVGGGEPNSGRLFNRRKLSWVGH